MGEDIRSAREGVPGRGEGLVRRKADAVGAEEHRIARDAGLALVRLAEAAVDNDELAARAQRAFAILDLDGDMAVDDAAPGLVEAEHFEYLRAARLAFVVLVIGVLGLFPGGFVLYERPLECGDVVAAEHGRVAPAPEEPEEILPLRALARALGGEHALPGEAVRIIEEVLARKRGGAELEAREAAVRLHGDAAVEEQVAVAAAVKRTRAQQEARMRLKLLAVAEGRRKLAHQRAFFRREAVGLLRIDRGEVRVAQGIFLAVDLNGTLFPIHAGEHVAIPHLIRRAPAHELSLEFEHDDADGFVHPGVEALVARAVRLRREVARLEGGGVAVALVREHRQRQQVDAVAVLEHVEVVVLQAVFHRRRDARGAAGGGAHPEHVVVAPLDVHVVVAHERLEYFVRVGAAVENIAHDVELVHAHALDEGRELDDERVRALGQNDGGDDVAVILLLVAGVGGVEQFLEDVRELLWQRLSDLRAGILRGRDARHGDEPAYGHAVPLAKVVLLGLDLLEPLERIIDQRAERLALRSGQRIAQSLVHLVRHGARAVVEYVGERLVLAVDVAHEVLRAFGQVEYGREVDDLRARGVYGGILPRELREVTLFPIGHDGSPFLFLHCHHIMGATKKEAPFFRSAALSEDEFL